jgi:hypothetical protein
LFFIFVYKIRKTRRRPLQKNLSFGLDDTGALLGYGSASQNYTILHGPDGHSVSAGRGLLSLHSWKFSFTVLLSHTHTHYFVRRSLKNVSSLLMRYGDDHPQKYDLSSLTVLGSVGEPINPEAWRWYYEVVGQKRATVVDTYWQTETGYVG